MKMWQYLFDRKIKSQSLWQRENFKFVKMQWKVEGNQCHLM